MGVVEMRHFRQLVGDRHIVDGVALSIEGDCVRDTLLKILVEVGRADIDIRHHQPIQTLLALVWWSPYAARSARTLPSGR